VALYQLGRLAEAEQALRRSLPMQKKPPFRLICEDQLGRALMAQGRWEEAANCFQECVAEFPQDCSGRLSLAELWLRRGQQADAALKEAKRAELDERSRKQKPGKVAQEIHETRLARCLAVQAWAMAKTGEEARPVEAAIQESFELSGQKAKPLTAEMHYFAARAYGELGNAAESDRHFQIAVATDPVGNFGRLAASALCAAGEGVRSQS